MNRSLDKSTAAIEASGASFPAWPAFGKVRAASIGHLFIEHGALCQME
jgi:hypothetical protein